MLKFQEEVRAFESALPSLLIEHEGQYVVIHGHELERQIFPTYEAALGWGYEKFGLESFFVKKIADQSHVTHYMRGFAA